MTGTGTLADPWTNATSCTLPFGSQLKTVSGAFSQYTVQPGDFTLPLNQLRDDATLSWDDLCDGTFFADHPPGGGNCVPDPLAVNASSASLIQQLVSSTTTDIHNAAHDIVLTVPTGTTVHDFVTVTGEPGKPLPTGNVTIDWFLNNTCTGAPAATSAPIALGAGGTVDATGFSFTVNTAGGRAFRAHYVGDVAANDAYADSDGPCEPLAVVDANIQISPPTAVNPTNTNHVLTITVNSIGHAAGTATASILPGGVGSFVGPATCNYAAGTSTTCTVTITSAVAGTTVVSATSGISVSGTVITRTTNTAVNTAAGGSGNASKTWEEPPPPGGDVFTPGYWKNHLAPLSPSCASKNGCSKNGPWTIDYLPISLGGFSVSSTTLVTSVFNAMNCAKDSSQDAVGCLAGHLLAAKLNVANGGSTCIAGQIAAADALLTSIGYTGPSGTYTLSASQRASAIAIKDALDKYNNGGGC